MEAGGAPPTPAHALDGTRLCEDDDDCVQQECLGFPPAETRICSHSCASNDDCVRGQICFGADELLPLCLKPCQGSEDCAYGFDCVRYLDTATVCLPSAWTEVFMGGGA